MTLSAIVNYGSNSMISTYNPVNAQDVATKNYVDSSSTGPHAAWINGGNILSIPGIFGTLNYQEIALIQNGQTLAILNSPNFLINQNLLIGAGIAVTLQHYL